MLNILVLALWVAFTGFGFWKGLLRILIPLAASILAMVLATRVDHFIAGWFSPFTSNESIQNVLAFIVVFLGIFIGGCIVGLFVRIATKIIPLSGMADRLAGAAAGALVGFILLAGVLTAAQRLPLDAVSEAVQESSVSVFMVDNFHLVTRAVKIVPSGWYRGVKP